MEKKYVIRDFNHDPEMEMYLADESSSKTDIWWKFWENKKPKDERYTPKVFKNIKEAKDYLKEIKRITANDWRENGHVYQLYGKRKFSWEINEYNDN
jgi:hypothetical protein